MGRGAGSGGRYTGKAMGLGGVTRWSGWGRVGRVTGRRIRVMKKMFISWFKGERGER